MTAPIVRQLILKDLYLVRWMILSAIASGLVAVGIMPLGAVMAYVGGVSLICVIVILNMFLVMSAVVQERKDKVHLFILSLPVSTAQYAAAKMLSNAIAFVVPWCILTAAVTWVIDVSALPNGTLPFLLTVLVYLLMYYCVLLAVAMISDSTGWHASVITIGNVSVNFLIPFLLALPSVSAHNTGAVAVWTGDIAGILAIQVVVAAAALWIAVHVRSRRSDFV
jgi:ABC-2 type transport system permease protein